MKSEIDFKKYRQQRDNLQKQFEDQKTGDQNLYRDQARLYKPVIESQKDTSKAIQEKLTANNDVLVPFTRELQRKYTDLSQLIQKNQDQLETMQSLPFYNIPEIEASTPKKTQESLLIDVDKDLLNDTHRENLNDMKLELPSIVQKIGTFEKTLKDIESRKRSIGQYLKEGSKTSAAEKKMYESQKETLKIYKGVILGLQGALQFVVKGKGIVRPKRGKGRPKVWKDTIVYSSPNDLVRKFMELCTAKSAGNTGLDNVINSVLDELLRIKVINKDGFDKIYTNFFDS
jgi:hypothetical protein